jgi:hypothetical protein
MHCDDDRPHSATTVHNSCKVASHSFTWDVLHVLAINHHLQGNVNTYKNMDVLGNIMLSYSQ